MNKSRLEAFSDGVLAIIITIMVLEIKVPHSPAWQDLRSVLPAFASYFISFLFIGIYWGNHHNLLHTVHHVTSQIMLANLNLLFWLSLIPFATQWMAENHFATNTIILYGVLLLIAGIAYGILQNIILRDMQESPLAQAIKKQTARIFISAGCDVVAIAIAFRYPIISGILFFFQSAIWLIPDKNIEKALSKE